MILNLKDLFTGGAPDINIDYTIDMSSIEINPGVYPFREPVRVQGVAANRAGVVTLSVRAECGYFTQCDRCLRDIVQPVVLTFENVLVKSITGEGSDEIVVCEDEKLDLDELVTATIILNLPMKHLCREDCKGLCPVCGKNLNDGDCGCAGDTGSSAFAALKDLIK